MLTEPKAQNAKEGLVAFSDVPVNGLAPDGGFFDMGDQIEKVKRLNASGCAPGRQLSDQQPSASIFSQFDSFDPICAPLQDCMMMTGKNRPINTISGDVENPRITFFPEALQLVNRLSCKSHKPSHRPLGGWAPFAIQLGNYPLRHTG